MRLHQRGTQGSCRRSEGTQSGWHARPIQSSVAGKRDARNGFHRRGQDPIERLVGPGDPEMLYGPRLRESGQVAGAPADGRASDTRCGSAVPWRARSDGRESPAPIEPSADARSSPRCSCLVSSGRRSCVCYCTALASLRMTKLSADPTPSNPAYLGASLIGNGPSRTSPALALIIWVTGS